MYDPMYVSTITSGERCLQVHNPLWLWSSLPPVASNIYSRDASYIFFSGGGSAARSSRKETAVTHYSPISTSDWPGQHTTHEYSQSVQRYSAKIRFSSMFDPISQYLGTRQSRYHSLHSVYQNSILDLNERAKASVTKKSRQKSWTGRIRSEGSIEIRSCYGKDWCSEIQNQTQTLLFDQLLIDFKNTSISPRLVSRR